MQIIKLIDSFTEWVQENVCDPKTFLKPSGTMSAGQEWITPTAFPMYYPTAEFLPEGAIAQAPGVCIQLMKGRENMVSGLQDLDIKMYFSIWRPGYYKGDDGNVDFSKTYDGYRDLWGWIDFAKAKIESDVYIDGLRVKKDVPIEFGPWKLNEEEVVNAYPFWYGWMTFTLENGASARNNKDYSDLL